MPRSPSPFAEEVNDGTLVEMAVHAYKVVLENDRVQMLESWLEPG